MALPRTLTIKESISLLISLFSLFSTSHAVPLPLPEPRRGGGGGGGRGGFKKGKGMVGVWVLCAFVGLGLLSLAVGQCIGFWEKRNAKNQPEGLQEVEGLNTGKEEDDAEWDAWCEESKRAEGDRPKSVAGGDVEHESEAMERRSTL